MKKTEKETISAESQEKRAVKTYMNRKGSGECAHRNCAIQSYKLWARGKGTSAKELAMWLAKGPGMCTERWCGQENLQIRKNMHQETKIWQESVSCRYLIVICAVLWKPLNMLNFINNYFQHQSTFCTIHTVDSRYLDLAFLE